MMILFLIRQKIYMRSLSKFFVSVQFLLMVKAIDRTVDTGVKLSHTKAIYVRDCGWQIYSFFFTLVQIFQILVFSFFVMIAVHRTETVFDMIVSVGAIHALQDVDLIVIEGFATLFGLIFTVIGHPSDQPPGFNGEKEINKNGLATDPLNEKDDGEL